MKGNQLKNILLKLDDHEKRIAKLEASYFSNNKKTKSTIWYKQGSTIHKIMLLYKAGFFSKPKSIMDIIQKLKSQDLHLKAPDLTLPLRKIVRKGILMKTRKLPDGTTSKKWLYKKS